MDISLENLSVDIWDQYKILKNCSTTSPLTQAKTFLSNASQPEVGFAFLSSGCARMFRQILFVKVKTPSNKNLLASRRIRKQKASFTVDVLRPKTPFPKIHNYTNSKLPSDLQAIQEIALSLLTVIIIYFSSFLRRADTDAYSIQKKNVRQKRSNVSCSIHLCGTGHWYTPLYCVYEAASSSRTTTSTIQREFKHIGVHAKIHGNVVSSRLRDFQ